MSGPPRCNDGMHLRLTLDPEHRNPTVDEGLRDSMRAAFYFALTSARAASSRLSASKLVGSGAKSSTFQAGTTS